MAHTKCSSMLWRLIYTSRDELSNEIGCWNSKAGAAHVYCTLAKQSNIDLREGLCSAVFVKTRVCGACSVSWAHKTFLRSISHESGGRGIKGVRNSRLPYLAFPAPALFSLTSSFQPTSLPPPIPLPSPIRPVFLSRVLPCMTSVFISVLNRLNTFGRLYGN